MKKYILARDWLFLIPIQKDLTGLWPTCRHNLARCRTASANKEHVSVPLDIILINKLKSKWPNYLANGRTLQTLQKLLVQFQRFEGFLWHCKMSHSLSHSMKAYSFYLWWQWTWMDKCDKRSSLAVRRGAHNRSINKQENRASFSSL